MFSRGRKIGSVGSGILVEILILFNWYSTGNKYWLTCCHYSAGRGRNTTDQEEQGNSLMSSPRWCPEYSGTTRGPAHQPPYVTRCRGERSGGASYTVPYMTRWSGHRGSADKLLLHTRSLFTKTTIFGPKVKPPGYLPTSHFKLVKNALR